MKEIFQKVVCGHNFTLGLTAAPSSQVFFWGNFRYYGGGGNSSHSEDYEVPTPLKSLEGRQFKDIACNRYQCFVLNDKGEILQWGKYLKEKIEGHKKTGGAPKAINRFPNTSNHAGKFDILLESISTGPNHSAGISVKKCPYTWGYPEGGRLGLSQHDELRAKNEPMIISYLVNLLQ
jgi:alpha-tubulin suppressor-like RCC1 family protein